MTYVAGDQFEVMVEHSRGNLEVRIIEPSTCRFKRGAYAAEYLATAAS